MSFRLHQPYEPGGDQPKAIAQLTASLKAGNRAQTLLGVTGSGKTFTVANAIANTQKPTLVIAHNKTLAAQLTQEFRTFFPEANVEYFVSYYDYYQPEAYIAHSDLYIEKEAQINQEIDRLRHAATSSLLRDPSSTIVVASVSCIYGLGSPDEYGASILDIGVGDKIDRQQLIEKLVTLYYDRSSVLERGRFRAQGSIIEVVPMSQERVVRIEIQNGRIASLSIDNLLTRQRIDEPNRTTIFPAKHFVASKEGTERAMESIESELVNRLKELRSANKMVEAERLERRTRYDLRLIKEVGYCAGIENYSRHFSTRLPGDAPETLIDYFPDDFLVVVDESHVTIPQIGAMYGGDKARKESLVDFGFRLPSAKDNRPLKFDEFDARVPQYLFVSATPGDYEIIQSVKSATGETISHDDVAKVMFDDSTSTIAQQVIRPTGLVDPAIDVRPVTNQVQDAIEEISIEVSKGQRVLVTALTKKMAEDLSEFLTERKIRAKYLHSDVETLDRITLLDDLRRGNYDVLVGVNLLREGLDLPEVSLVVILDADNEGFLRSDRSLIQTMGRAARNVDGRVILYADRITGSMSRAMDETERRRNRQLEYNQQHGITPASIQKAIASIRPEEETPVSEEFTQIIDLDDIPKIIREREKQMKELAKDLQFEQAADVRDEVIQLKRVLKGNRLTPQETTNGR